jgi:hypothetical protein
MLSLTGITVFYFAEAKGPSKNSNDDNKVIGIKRHPDSIHDSDGVLHKVWQEPVDGQYEIFYARQGENKEMGIGADNNPSIRITDTPYDSVWPQIAFDTVTDLIYIMWTEHTPANGIDSQYLHSPEPCIMYVATMPDEDDDNGPAFTTPINLASGSSQTKQFTVTQSEFEIQLKGGVTYSLKGTLDTDGDYLIDYEEILGTKGYITSWRIPDTDNDGLLDYVEYQYDLNPLLDESKTGNSNLHFHAILMSSDNDEDGLTYGKEISTGFPVTVGAANIHKGGHATYRFYPREDFSATLSLDVMLKRYSIYGPSTPANASYSIIVTVESEELDTVELTKSGILMEFEYFKINIGPFDVAEDAETDIRIDVNLSAFTGKKQIVKGPIVKEPPTLFRIMEVTSLMIKAPSPDYDMFSYKEGRDFLPDESDKAYELIKDIVINPDPWRADIFVEVDYLEDHAMPPELFSEAINAYSDAAIILHYKLDEKDLPLDSETDPDEDDDGAETLRYGEEIDDFLDRHRNEDYSEYIHVIFASLLYDADHDDYFLGIANSADTADDITSSGIVVADEDLIDLITAETNIFERRLKTFIHEIGHVLNCAHEKDEGDGGSYDARIDQADGDDIENHFNVMLQNHFSTWKAKFLFRGHNNDARIRGATDDIGRPRFSVESIDQMDLQSKLSVETGRNIDLLGNYV